jgi:hypothetical protein
MTRKERRAHRTGRERPTDPHERLNDHEGRLRTLERYMTLIMGGLVLLSVEIPAVIALFKAWK